MATRLTDEQVEQVFVLYEQHKSMEKVGAIMNISKSTVHKIINHEQKTTKHERLVADYKKVKEQAHLKLIEMMQSTTVDTIVSKALARLDDETNLNNDVKKYGISNMYRLVGMFTDKTMAIKEYEIKLKQLAIREKELAIKEKELELRISNPEAFHQIQIVNDAPPPRDMYEPRVTD